MNGLFGREIFACLGSEKWGAVPPKPGIGEQQVSVYWKGGTSSRPPEEVIVG